MSYITGLILFCYFCWFPREELRESGLSFLAFGAWVRPLLFGGSFCAGVGPFLYRFRLKGGITVLRVTRNHVVRGSYYWV